MWLGSCTWKTRAALGTVHRDGAGELGPSASPLAELGWGRVTLTVCRRAVSVPGLGQPHPTPGATRHWAHCWEMECSPLGHHRPGGLCPVTVIVLFVLRTPHGVESPAWLPPPVHGSLFCDFVLETTGLGAITQMCLPHRRSVNFHFSLLGDSPSPPVGCLLLGPGKGRGKWCFSRQRPSQQRSLINSPGAPCPSVCPGARSQPCPQSLEVKEGSVRTPRGVLRPSPRHTRFLAGVRPAGTS